MDVKTRIRDHFAEVIPQAVGDEDDIFELGLVDSMFGMELVAFVEDEFSIVVEDQDLDIQHFVSVVALTAFVESKHRRQAAAQPHGSAAH
jgi:acyl carrier protein